jgi:hypothetical protein
MAYSYSTIFRIGATHPPGTSSGCSPSPGRDMGF